MKQAIAGQAAPGTNLPGVVGEIAGNSSCFLDNQSPCCCIPGPQREVEVDVQPAGGHIAEAQSSRSQSAQSPDLQRHLGHQMGDDLPLPLGPGPIQSDQGVGQRFNMAHSQALTVQVGALATLCTVIFDDKARADIVCKALGTDTVDHSGWHVYANMEHILNYFRKIGRPVEKGSFPVTDDLLSRSINISVGVVDGGLGAGWGINILSTDEEIEQKAEAFQKACKA